MRLVYAYFDFCNSDVHPSGYRGMKQCGLNFSTDYEYSVKPIGEAGEKRYNISRGLKPPDKQITKDFWGDERLYNITALVGDNGAGKTTLIHALIQACAYSNQAFEGMFLIVMEKREATAPTELFVYSNKIHQIAMMLGEIRVHVLSEYPDKFMNIKLMLMNNTLNWSDTELWDYYMNSLRRTREHKLYQNDYRSQFFNCSMLSMIENSNYLSQSGKNSDSITITDQIKRHFRYETYQELRFIFDKYQRDKLLQFHQRSHSGSKLTSDYVPFPDKVSIDIWFPNVLFFSNLRYYEAHLPKDKTAEQERLAHLLEIEEYIFESLSLEGRDILAELSLNCIINYLFESDLLFVREFRSRFCEYRQFPHDRNIYEGFLRSLNPESRNKQADVEKPDEKKDKFINFLVFIWDHEETIESYFHYIPNSDDSYYVEVERVPSAFMADFLNLYRSITDIYYFLTFSCGMSSGEKNMLHMLTKFRYLLDGPAYYTNNNDTKDVHNELINIRNEERIPCDTLFLFLDEADLTYHPEWQRRFINLLTSFLPRMFKSCKDIQVILTTHSPLMLGDLPSGNVIYLKKEKTKKHLDEACQEDDYITIVDDARKVNTFGQNLYTILNDGFYMESTIGEFAHQKIKEVIDWIETIKTAQKKLGKIKLAKTNAELEQHRQFVNLLADGIIKRKLESELDDCSQILDDSLPQEDLLKKKQALEAELKRINARLEKKL